MSVRLHVWVCECMCVFMYVCACIHVCVGVGGGGGAVSRSSSNRKSSIRTTIMKKLTLITFQTSRNSHVKAFATAWKLIITLAPAFSCKSKTLRELRPTCGFTLVYGNIEIDELFLWVVWLYLYITTAIGHRHAATVSTAHSDWLACTNATPDEVADTTQ